ncbi:MAG: TolC family protein [Bacteroidales bacterium]
MVKKSVWVYVLFLLLGLQATAQTAVDDTIRLSLSVEEANVHALQHNRTLKKAGMAVEQAEWEKIAAIANYLPQVSANANYTDHLGAQLNLLGQSITMEPSSTLTIQATQLIFNANALLGMRMADLAKKMSQSGSELTQLAIIQNVNSVYYSILSAEDNRRLLQQNVENVRKLAMATRSMVEVGISEQTEADQMDVTLANLENTLKSTERTIEIAYNSLRLLLGVDAHVSLQLTDRLGELLDTTDAYGLLTEPFVMNLHPEVKTSLLSVDLKKEERRMALATYLPSITAVYQYNEKLKTSGFDMTLKQNITFTASMPLFSSGGNYAKAKKAKLGYLSAQEDYQMLVDQMEIQDKQLRYNLKSALETYEIQQKNILVSKRVFENISKKYEQGLSSSLELTNASNSLLTAQGNYIGAVMNLLTAKDELAKLLGEL